MLLVLHFSWLLCTAIVLGLTIAVPALAVSPAQVQTDELDGKHVPTQGFGNITRACKSIGGLMMFHDWVQRNFLILRTVLGIRMVPGSDDSEDMNFWALVTPGIRKTFQSWEPYG